MGEEHTVLRACRAVKTGGRVLHYRLLQSANGGFCVSVRCRKTRAAVRDLTRDPRRARALFSRISRAGVFPCHLAEIAEDLLSET